MVSSCIPKQILMAVLLLDWAARPATGPERPLPPRHDTRLLLGVWDITAVCFSRGDAQLAGTREARGTPATDSRSRCRPGTSCRRRSESP